MDKAIKRMSDVCLFANININLTVFQISALKFPSHSELPFLEIKLL